MLWIIRNDKMGSSRWVCQFCSHFITGQTKNLGIHPLMCLPRPVFYELLPAQTCTWVFVCLCLKCAVPADTSCHRPDFGTGQTYMGWINVLCTHLQACPLRPVFFGLLWDGHLYFPPLWIMNVKYGCLPNMFLPYLK